MKVSKLILTRTFVGECTKRCTRSEQLTCDPVMSSVWSRWQFFPIAESVWELRTASFRISSVSIGQLEASAERNGWIANSPFKTNMLDPKTNLKFDTIQITFVFIMPLTSRIHFDYIFYWKHWAGEIMHVTFHLHVSKKLELRTSPKLSTCLVRMKFELRTLENGCCGPCNSLDSTFYHLLT